MEFEPSDALGEEDLAQLDGPDESESPSGIDGVIDRAFDAQAPGPSVDEIQADYGLSREPSMMLRGFLRMLGGGMPPIGDVGVGGVLWTAKAYQTERGEESNSGSSDGSDGPAVVEVPANQ